MRFDLSDQQADILQAVEMLLGRLAGAKRMRELGGDQPRYDSALDAALLDGGFTGIAASTGAGSLDAALVAEAVAVHLGVVPFSTAALVGVSLLGEVPPGPVAIVSHDHRGPVRFAHEARTLLVYEGHEASVASIEPGRYETVASRFGFPLGNVDDLPADRTTLAPGSGARLRAWWQVALAVDLAATMGAALDFTVRHVSNRQQFGRPIGSFQALQHRLAEASVLVEGARWLAREAVWQEAPQEAAAVALSFAMAAAPRLITDCHQLSGAIGFATDFDLHLWTMRMPALRLEGQLTAPSEQAVAARWPAAAAASMR
jgi:alkylation response protein AidB-like acyl-CoA dehydrogenase